jgi:hypothetical protein
VSIGRAAVGSAILAQNGQSDLKNLSRITDLGLAGGHGKIAFITAREVTVCWQYLPYLDLA